MGTSKEATRADMEASLVAAIGPCTPERMEQILKVAESHDQEALLFVACLMVCSLRSEFPAGTRTCQGPLDALAACKHPAAEPALRHMAQHAQNGRIQIEAARRLGNAASRATRSLLYDLAKTGACNTRGFGQDTLEAGHMRVAALEALGTLTKPTAADGEAILEALQTEVCQGSDSDVFRACTNALAKLCKPTHLAGVLKAAEGCRNPAMALRLLGACRSLSTLALTKQKAVIFTILCGAQGDLDDNREPELLNDLCELAARVTDADLIKRLADTCAGQPLERGKGRIAAAALAAYSKKDGNLATAYLRFAENHTNIHAGSPCLSGLAACATLGYAKAIADRIVQQAAHGHQQLLRSCLLLQVFGTVDSVVQQLCEALGRMDDQDRRANSAKACCETVVRISIPDNEQQVLSTALEEIRANSVRRAGNGDIVGRIAVLVERANAGEDALAVVARKVCKPATVPEGPGVVSIAKHLLAPPDKLGRAFLTRVLNEARAVEIRRPGEIDKDSPLKAVEEAITPEYSEILKRVGETGILVDGRLNRYLLDLMRRQSITFHQVAKAALVGCTVASDVLFALDCIAESGDAGSVRLLTEASKHHGLAVEPTNQIRATALGLLATLLTGGTVNVPAAEREEALTAVHCRFEDNTSVRRAAYTAAAILASPQSITALRSRLLVEKSAQGREAIAGALTKIRDRLLHSPPGSNDAPALVGWLGHLGALGDGQVADSATRFLLPPHPEASVRVAALDCISMAGNRQMIEVIDHFMEETSPSGEVLLAARKAKASLQGRNDMDFMEALGLFAPAESPLLDLSVDYEELWGPANLRRLTTALVAMSDQWDTGHWADFVTRTDALCDVLCRHLYDRFGGMMGLDKRKVGQLTSMDYGARLHHPAFRTTFPRIHPLMLFIHDMRQDAGVAHMQKKDGTDAKGVGKTEANLVRQQFTTLFDDCVAEFGKAQG